MPPMPNAKVSRRFRPRLAPIGEAAPLNRFDNRQRIAMNFAFARLMNEMERARRTQARRAALRRNALARRTREVNNYVNKMNMRLRRK